MYFHLVTIKYHKLITAAFNLNPLRSTCTYYQYIPHFSLTLFTCKHIFVLLSLFPIASTLCEVLAKVHSVEIMKELCCMFVCLWSLNSLGYVLQNIYSMTELSILIIAVCLSGHLFFLPSPEIWQRSLFPLCSIRFAWSIQQVANEKCFINKTPPVPQDVESSIKTTGYLPQPTAHHIYTSIFYY